MDTFIVADLRVNLDTGVAEADIAVFENKVVTLHIPPGRFTINPGPDDFDRMRQERELAGNLGPSILSGPGLVYCEPNGNPTSIKTQAIWVFSLEEPEGKRYHVDPDLLVDGDTLSILPSEPVSAPVEADSATALLAG